MLDFKSQVKHDFSVFNALDEFATNITICYNGDTYNILAILDNNMLNLRKKNAQDNADGFYNVDVVLYFRLDNLGFLPKINNRIEVDYEVYNIVSAVDEVGEVVLGLQRFDEC